MGDSRGLIRGMEQGSWDSHFFSTLRVKQFGNSLKQFGTKLLQEAASNSKSLRILAKGRPEMSFGFEYCYLGAIERFAVDQIADDLLGNQLPIDHD